MRVNAFDKTTLPALLLMSKYRLGGSRLKSDAQRTIICFIDDGIIYFDAVRRRRMAVKPISPRPASIMA
jgi:hypothetical protein